MSFFTALLNSTCKFVLSMQSLTDTFNISVAIKVQMEFFKVRLMSSKLLSQLLTVSSKSVAGHMSCIRQQLCMTKPHICM